MTPKIQAAHRFLVTSHLSGSGWPYRPGSQASPEPTCESLMALAGAETTAEIAALRPPAWHWLESRLTPDGALTLEGDNEPHWTTSLLVMALTGQSDRAALRAKAVDFLLKWKGMPAANQVVNELDGSLIGWPWHNGAFSWVEPTSYAMIALKSAGHRKHPRVLEAEKLLVDRVCKDGGWNYGNRVVFNKTLQGFPTTTALAALALQGSPESQAVIDRALVFLEQRIREHQSTLVLALGILCFQAFSKPFAELVPALESRQQADGSWRQQVHLTALASLALQTAGGGPNPFALQAARENPTP